MKILYSIHTASYEIDSPSAEVLTELLARVNNTDFPYLILEADDSSYIQTAGEANRMIVEVRLYKGTDFEHYVVEKPKDSHLLAVASSVPGASNPPAMTDVLTLADCEKLFMYFLNNKSIDKNFSYKNITNNYK